VTGTGRQHGTYAVISTALKKSAMQLRPDDAVSTAESRIEAFARVHARRIVVVLCVYAAIRILVFAAAFPLFNITDEASHFLAIRMFAEGHLPNKQLPPVDSDFAETFIPYFSPEYIYTQEYLDRNGPRIPLYQLPPQAWDEALRQTFYVQKFSDWSQKPNFEAQSPPLYYMAAAGWYNLGAALGIRAWGLAYWVRFLNPIIYASLVWLSYRFVHRVYPERPFLYLAVPALIAVFPQDVFFGMNRDVLSAPLTAIALILMTKAADSKRTEYWSLVFGSFVVGLAFLVEVSNCVLYGALAASCWFWARHPDAPRMRRIMVISASALAAVGPPLLWIGRNYFVLGDFTGARAKMHELTWTAKPFADIFHHPLFTPDGLSYFLLQLTRTFWHGEYRWHGQWMRSAGADWLYVFSSALLFVIFAVDLLLRRRALSPAQRLAGFQSLWLVSGSILFLAGISLLFDFHDCIGPSRLHPFFINGRIISGALLPFVLIYAGGLEVVVNRFRKWIPPLAVLLYLMLFITISEIVVRKQVFSSAYNFFALSAWPR
jgi:hypothetical protein